MTDDDRLRSFLDRCEAFKAETGTRFPGVCNICDEMVAAENLLEHLRLIHPDTFGDGPPRWPDGKPAIAVLPHDTQPFEG